MRIIKIWATFQTELKYHDHYLADEMADMGHETVFLTSDKPTRAWLPYLKRKTFDPGMEYYNESCIIRLKSIELFGKIIPLEIKKMKELLTRDDTAILHLFGIGNPIMFMAIWFAIKRGKATPVIVANDHSNPSNSGRSIPAWIYYGINKFLFRMLGRHIKRIFVPNSATRNLLMRRYRIKDPAKVRILPLGYNDRVFRYVPKKRNRSKKMLIGFAGKINPAKRIEVLLEAIASSSRKNRMECWICGAEKPSANAYVLSLYTFVEENHLSVKFFPLLPPAALSEFYNHIDIAVFPGSISITTIEANGCGTPCLLYNSIEGLDDRVENGRGELFNSTEELTRMLEKYLDFKDKNAIHHQRIEQYTRQYSWRYITKRYLMEYERCLSGA